MVSDVTTLPFAGESFDIIHCRWVLEHLAEPVKVFREFARVLKPGGRLLALTPNVHHYSMTISMCTPHWFHRWWKGEDSHHFPTFYRANSPRAIRRLCARSGLQLERLQLIEGAPRYFSNHPFLFYCGMLYERTVNSTSLLGWLRFMMVVEVVRPVVPSFQLSRQDESRGRVICGLSDD
jgi:SAM-dependent methyltransferase